MKSEDRLATLTLGTKSLHNQVRNHFLEPHIVLGEIDPAFGDLLDVIKGDLEGYLPVVHWDIRYRIIRDLSRHVDLFIFIVGHDTEILLDVIEVHFELAVNLLCIHCALVDLLEKLILGTSIFHVVLTTEYACDVVYDPLAVDA